MEKKDLNELTQLINKYGIFDIKKLVDVNEQLLTYIYNTRFNNTINEKQSSFLYTETNNSYMFTNGKTSVFCINKKLINLSLLTQNIALELSPSLYVSPEEIYPFFGKTKDLFGYQHKECMLENNETFILNGKESNEIERISINEYKLIKLLLENAKTYISLKNTIMYAEGDNGYAYVLGKKDGKQNII